jgi:hypothetical protein
MSIVGHAGVSDDAVWKLWAAITFLGEARECDSPAHLGELLLKAESLLSDVIGHLATLTLLGATASMQTNFH